MEAQKLPSSDQPEFDGMIGVFYDSGTIRGPEPTALVRSRQASTNTMTKIMEIAEATPPVAVPARKGRPALDRATNKSYERIQVAALMLFSEKGVEPTSIRDIGKKANVPTSLLYHYAPSKYKLVFDLMVDGMKRYQSSASDARALGETPEEKLVGLITAHIIMHCRNRQLAKLIDNGWRPLPKADKDVLLAVRDNYSRLWDEVLDEGQAAGIFDIEQPHLARLAIVQMCSVSTWFRPTGLLTIPDLVERFGDLVFGTIRAARDGKPVRFTTVARPPFSEVLQIVERHHQGAVFGKKR
jgi:AcrR family transcriptional regulator